MKDEYNYLEKLNQDYLDVVESKEYLTGQRMEMIKGLLKKGKFITLIKRIIIHLRLKKYNKCPTKAKTICNDINLVNKKIAVYTCMIGDYDYVKSPKYLSQNCDYFIITDSDKNFDSLKKLVVTNEVKDKLNNNNILINRYFKMNPFDVFKDYDYAIYIDANIEIISDISKLIKGIDNNYGMAMHAHAKRNCIYNEGKVCKILKKGNKKNIIRHLERYKIEKFPNNYGMLECGVIAIDLKNPVAKKIMNNWWQEFINSESLRDQLSLPYILWKENIPVENLTGLGKNIYFNPLYRITKKHK